MSSDLRGEVPFPFAVAAALTLLANNCQNNFTFNGKKLDSHMIMISKTPQRLLGRNNFSKWDKHHECYGSTRKQYIGRKSGAMILVEKLVDSVNPIEGNNEYELQTRKGLKNTSTESTKANRAIQLNHLEGYAYRDESGIYQYTNQEPVYADSIRANLKTIESIYELVDSGDESGCDAQCFKFEVIEAVSHDVHQEGHNKRQCSFLNQGNDEELAVDGDEAPIADFEANEHVEEQLYELEYQIDPTHQAADQNNPQKPRLKKWFVKMESVNFRSIKTRLKREVKMRRRKIMRKREFISTLQFANSVLLLKTRSKRRLANCQFQPVTELTY
ncbi:hypothetical protein LXL04_006480 [Taraxacum kok-saghyz]